MTNAALQPIATIVAAAIALVPLLLALLGDRSSRRQARDIGALEKLQQIRPNFETPEIRRTVDDIAYDYLEDIQIGLRDDSRPARIASAVVVAVWILGLGVRLAASKTTDVDVKALLDQLVLVFFLLQMVVAGGLLLGLIVRVIRNRAWRRLGRVARRRARALERAARRRQEDARRHVKEQGAAIRDLYRSAEEGLRGAKEALRGAKEDTEQVTALMASSEDTYASLVDVLGLDDEQAQKLRRLRRMPMGGDQSGGPT